MAISAEKFNRVRKANLRFFKINTDVLKSKRKLYNFFMINCMHEHIWRLKYIFKVVTSFQNKS